MPSLIFRKGLDLKQEVAGALAHSYHSALVQQIKAEGYRYQSGRLTVHLAREFGFCYGVDRAVDYAYQASLRFPDRQVFLTGEIIHNPHVNDQLRESTARLNAGFSRLSDTWRDQGHQKFAQEYQQTMRVLTQFMHSADAQIPFSQQRAQRLREVYR